MRWLKQWQQRLRSIRRRVLLLVSLVYLLSSGVSSLWIYVEVSEEVDELFDAEMVQQAKTLATLMRDQALNEQDDVIIAALGAHEYEERVAYRMESLNSAYALVTMGAPTSDELPYAEGFQVVQTPTGVWHSFGMTPANGSYRLLLMQEDSFRSELRTDLVVDTLIPILFLLPFILWSGWLVINRSFSSFNRLAEQLRRRKSDDYRTFPLEHDDEEIAIVKGALNQYVERIAKTLQREKRFSADAAHELRTPLAALKTSLQNLQGSITARDAKQVEHTIESTDRLIDLVESLLTLSRAELPPTTSQQLNLASIVRDIIATQVPRAEQRGLRFVVELPKQIGLSGAADYWHVLLSNLIDNAIKYAPADTVIVIDFSAHQQQLFIVNQITDSAEVDVQRVGERFYRGQHLNIKGSGLGASIVASLALQLNAAVTYQVVQNQFTVAITLPKTEERSF
ncbi:histidine kinase dimerization/phospho-acceptor domain-containing protein [Pseudidiomarina atlantica]|uniref:histidine kinase dimerization/phospho-acceptor domain-containing protein n=1 Tax=Pseudidiomarina atlantica TaxID=1517416 RepID=UPI00068F6637|nr:histidine kinase dimerization/phospho-acceptor domain-containing protein [Pseudidiomarina atlantica]